MPLSSDDKQDAILARADVPAMDTKETRRSQRGEVIKLLGESWAKRDLTTKRLIALHDRKN
jgi:hypothetical protein